MLKIFVAIIKHNLENSRGEESFIVLIHTFFSYLFFMGFKNLPLLFPLSV